MNKELYDLAVFSIKTAKSAGADDCRVSISKDRLVEISYREQKTENIKEASTKGLYIQIYVNGRYSGQSTSDLRKDALTTFITNAVATTKLLAEDPFRSLPDPKYYKGRKNIDLENMDPAYDSFTSDDRLKIVKLMEKTCLKKGGEKLISTTASENDGYNESVIVTTNGFEGYQQSTYYVAIAEMTAQGKGDRRPEGYDYAVALKKDDLPDPAIIGKNAVKNTLSQLGAKKVKTETLPIIIQNRSVSRILGGFIAGMNGGNIQQKRSFLADKKDQKVVSPLLTLIDDPFIKGGLGSKLFDGDGFATKKRIMIDKGVLKDFYISWYYSKKLECEPTTSSPSNLILPPGKRSVEEIMKDLGRGILITSFIGGNSNSTTGDFSIGISGQLFEGGKPIQAICEMNISDNHLEFWKKITEIANDPWMYSSQRMPSLVFKDIVVSGL